MQRLRPGVACCHRAAIEHLIDIRGEHSCAALLERASGGKRGRWSAHVCERHRAQHQRRGGHLAQRGVCVKGCARASQLPTGAGEVGVDLFGAQWLEEHGTAQVEARLQGVVVGHAAGDHQGGKRLGAVLAVVVDRLDTCCAVLGRHLVQAVQEGQNPVACHPGLPDLARHVVALVQLVHKPIRERQSLRRPGR